MFNEQVIEAMAGMNEVPVVVVMGLVHGRKNPPQGERHRESVSVTSSPAYPAHRSMETRYM
jgi:hypothetical protein